MSSDGQMEKENVALYLQRIIIQLHIHKQNGNLPSATMWVKLEGIVRSGIRQREREILYDITHR